MPSLRQIHFEENKTSDIKKIFSDVMNSTTLPSGHGDGVRGEPEAARRPLLPAHGAQLQDADSFIGKRSRKNLPPPSSPRAWQ